MNLSINAGKKFASLALASATLGMLLSSGARADELGTTSVQMHVRFADLDLKTPDGVAALYRRIRIAASEACGGYNARQFGHGGGYEACSGEAMAKAVVRIDNPLLTARFMQKMPGANKVLASVR